MATDSPRGQEQQRSERQPVAEDLRRSDQLLRNAAKRELVEQLTDFAEVSKMLRWMMGSLDSMRMSSVEYALAPILVGLVVLIALAAKNGILMLDAVEEHLAAGDTLRQALLRSGRRRFRPVLMTSLAAMLGMLPLALAIGAGSELLQPLAIAVIGGLTMALALSLIVTPTVYAMFAQAKGATDDRY